jgi:hypothetical protein
VRGGSDGIFKIQNLYLDEEEGAAGRGQYVMSFLIKVKKSEKKMKKM